MTSAAGSEPVPVFMPTVETNDSLSTDGALLRRNYECKLYKRRWPILALFVLYSTSNAFQWIQYSIINNIIVRYYDVTTFSVDWTSMIYMVLYIPLIFPAAWILDKKVSKAETREVVGNIVAQQMSSCDRCHSCRYDKLCMHKQVFLFATSQFASFRLKFKTQGIHFKFVHQYIGHSRRCILQSKYTTCHAYIVLHQHRRSSIYVRCYTLKSCRNAVLSP